MDLSLFPCVPLSLPVSLSLCPSLPVPLCPCVYVFPVPVCLSLCPSLCPCVYVFQFLCVSVPVSLSLSLCLRLSLRPCLSVSVPVSLFLCRSWVFLSLSVVESLSQYLSFQSLSRPCVVLVSLTVFVSPCASCCLWVLVYVCDSRSWSASGSVPDPVRSSGRVSGGGGPRGRVPVGG